MSALTPYRLRSGGWIAMENQVPVVLPPANQAPGAVTGLNADPGVRTVTLAWLAAVDPENALAGYLVYRGSTLLTTTPITTTSYAVSDLTPSTSYNFSVVAVDDQGALGPTSTVTTTTLVSTGVPDDSNTGPTITLRPLYAGASGPGWSSSDGQHIGISADGADISGWDIPGAIYNGRNLSFTISDCRVRFAGEADWGITLGPNSIIRDCELGGGADGVTYTRAIAVYSAGPNNLIERCNIHHQVHGLRLDGGTTVQDTYIHHIPMGDPLLWPDGLYHTEDHTNCSMTTGGWSSGPIIFRRNHCIGGNSTNFFVQWDGSSPKVNEVSISDNLFVNDHRNGQDATYGAWVQPNGVIGPVSLVNNTFSTGWQVGPYSMPDGATVTGNKLQDGTPI